MSPIRQCAIKDCRSKGDKVTLHSIPSSLKRQEKWKKALKPFLEEKISDATVICSKHFKKSDYAPSLTSSKSLLCKSAVPSVFTSNMPKKQPEVVVRPRHQSRRAASKEALKQMQILLEDENDAVEIPDDDDVIPIPVAVSPPKKKYKLTHRKSSDGNDREVLVLKSITPNITNHYVENNLELECWVEELEPCQKERNKKLEEEEKALQSKLDELIKACKGEVVYKGDLTTVIEVSEHVQKTIQAVQASYNKPPIVLNNTVANPQPGYQLVMDPRVGLIVGAMPPANQTPTKQGKIQVATNLQAPVTPTNQSPVGTRRSRAAKKQAPVVQQTPPPPSPINTRSLPASRSGPSPVSTRSGPSAINTRSAPAPVSTRSAPSPVGTRSSASSPINTRSGPSPINTRSGPASVGTRSAPSPINTRSAAPSPVSTRSAAPAPGGTRSAAPSPVGTRSAAPSPVGTRSAAPSPAGTRSVLNTKQPNKRTAPQPPPAAPPATRSRREEPTPPTPTPPTTRSRPGGAVVNARPTETSVEGGLTTGTNAKTKTIVDLTSDDGRPLPDSREISFNKLQGKTFPSLVVVARPHLRVTDVNSDRGKLDGKVKSVLMYAPTKFTEWLIQQGLVKSEQKCSIHTSTQLKLGMYSDVSKFPYSGGYVWISECCPQRFVSVFSGSIFEGSPHPPLVILKILYHWSCQTNIQNVTQWVKVDNLYVKGMYTWLRSICTVALQSHIRQLGGPQTKVEVGVISLGTTSQDGNSRQVKVEVLGILETSSKLIRLRAIEPLADGDRNYKKRFSKILEPLAQWVHPSSIIVTDLTVDKATLHQMGFSTVMQTTSVDANNSNRTIMEYLRRIVPRMFQNTLSLLSRQIIQQFLDELVWREWFGTTSMQAFDNLILHLAEQTRFESNQSLIVKLNRVASNPFKTWGAPTTSTTTTAPVPAATTPTATKAADSASKKRKRKEPEPPKPAPPKPAPPKAAPPKPATAPVPEINRPPKSTSPDVPEQMVPLENYYYGTVDNYPPKTNVTLNMKCPFCKETFNNNIVLMNHLFKHAHNVSQDGQMCRYCLTSVPTANDLLKHISTAHPAETKHDNGFVCLICETQYMNPFVLGKHMSKEHCPSELPYQCGTCGYRCSNHKQAIDHFYKQHDNGPTIQCPFCLKSTTVFSSSRNIAQNMHYFIQHLQKHQRKQFARRCGKCNLWFVQKDVLKDHQTKMHASQRGKTGLVPWFAPRNGVMVPKSKMDKYPCDAEGINFTTLFYNVPKDLKCKECDGPMDTPKHFPSFESCQNPNCQYSTCCSNAMQEHNAKCNKISQNNVPKDKLPYEMFCICGYSNHDGNQMARHLAVCERKSAYPSLSDAKTASVTHSMLDVLGLVRKPEETDKKQTAITRNIKRIVAKTEPEPETITVDEDEPEETKDLDIVTKKIKRDLSEGSKKSKSKAGTSEKVIKVMEIDTTQESPSTLNKESEDVKKITKTSKKSKEICKESENIVQETAVRTNDSEKINEKSPKTSEGNEVIEKGTEVIEKGADPIEKEAETIEKEAETREKEAETMEKETETVEKEVETIEKEAEMLEKDAEIIEKEAETIEKEDDMSKEDTEQAQKEPENSNNSATEKEESPEEIGATDISMSEDKASSEKSAETSKAEKLSVTEADSSQQEKDEDIEQSQITDSVGEENIEKNRATDSEEKDELFEKTDNEQCENIETENKDRSLEETEVEHSQTIEKEDNIPSEETEVKHPQTIESEEKDGSIKDKDESLEDKDESLEDKYESLDDKDKSLENKDQSVEDKDDSLEDKNESLKDKDESLEDKDESVKDKDESPEEAGVERFNVKEGNEIESETSNLDTVEKSTTPTHELEDKSEDIERSYQEESNQMLENKLETPIDLEKKDEVRSRDGDSETGKEQALDAPERESTVEENEKDKLEDIIMSEISSEISKEPEQVDEDRIVDESSSDKFENISDKDENVSQLPDVSSPAEDLPSSTQGVYDDVSESSDNAASKFLEDPESAILNLGESEEAGHMEVGQVGNPERGLEAMDYEDISNTGLDSLTSMETD